MKIACTAIILTHRADVRFVQALASVQNFDEVLIYDNESNNDWDSLKKDYTFTIKQLPTKKITNFADVRNQALKDATNQWVFFLDSDETLEPVKTEEIASLITKNDRAAYTVTRSDIFLNKQLHYGEAGAQKIVRLLKKDSTTFVHAIHETAVVDGVVAHSSLRIKHFSHTSITQFITDVSFYAYEVSKSRNTSRFRTLVELIFYPVLKSVYTFIILGGFLDGYRGLIYSYIMSLHSLLVRIYRYEQTLS